MKRQIVLIFLISSCSVFPGVLSFFSAETGGLSGSSAEMNNYLHYSFGDWEITDRFFTSYSFEGSEYYTAGNGTYAKNGLKITNSSDILDISAGIGIEYYDDGLPVEFTGLQGLYSMENGITSVLAVSKYSKKFSVNLSLRYSGRQYSADFQEYTDRTSEFNGDLFAECEAGYAITKSMIILAGGSVFDDLNRNNYLSYYESWAGIRYRRKFSSKYVVKQTFTAGYSDLYDGIPYNFKSVTRIIWRSVPDWTAYFDSEFRLYAVDDLSGIYSGNSYAGFMVQRSFRVDGNNNFARIRAGAAVDPADRWAVVNAGGVYPVNPFELSAEYKFYPGDEGVIFKEHYISAGLMYYFNEKKIRAGYFTDLTVYNERYSDFLGQSSSITHRFIIQTVL